VTSSDRKMSNATSPQLILCIMCEGVPRHNSTSLSISRTPSNCPPISLQSQLLSNKFLLVFIDAALLTYCLHSSRVLHDIERLLRCVIKQEGWLSPKERASVSAISLRHIIWLPNESHAGMSLPTAVRRVQDLATSRESKAHFGLPWVRPLDNRGKCYTWIEREFNACQTHRSMYPSIFNRFPVIRHVSSNVRHLALFCTFWPLWLRPWDNRSKCHTVGKRNQCL